MTITPQIQMFLEPDDAVKLLKELRIAIVRAKVNKSGGHFAHLGPETESQILADCEAVTAESNAC
jgi:hypothetical protein